MGDLQEIVIHADDVGMCHGANAAFVELSKLGSISAGSVMVPCPWFSEMAQIVAADSPLDTPLDLGVHLTLNSEQKGYRWGPVSQPSRAAGLTDEHGFFWPTVAEVQRQRCTRRRGSRVAGADRPGAGRRYRRDASRRAHGLGDGTGVLRAVRRRGRRLQACRCC